MKAWSTCFVRDVEELLDSCHALMNYGVDRYKRPYPISAEKEKRRQVERAEYIQRNLNDLWRTVPQTKQVDQAEVDCFPCEPQEKQSIIDYLLFAKKYIAECEERHGVREVEELLDSCHALMNYGVDRYKRPYPISAEKEKRRQVERAEYIQRNLNDLWRTVPQTKQVDQAEVDCFPCEPQENLLYFIEKNAPLLEPWQREMVRIVRKVAQYFYPQRQTQVMNEGWASFWHYTLINTLYDEGLVHLFCPGCRGVARFMPCVDELRC